MSMIPDESGQDRRRDDDAVLLDRQRPVATGRLLVNFKPGIVPRGKFDFLVKTIGSEAANASFPIEEIEGGAGLSPTDLSNRALLARLGVVVIGERAVLADSKIAALLDAAGETKTVRPEFYLFASETWRDTNEATWGIGATRAKDSGWTGKGIKLAILDTGLDLGHPDFAGRAIVSRSFVTNETVDDVQGHGTHCAGTAAGAMRAQGEMRYGVAPDVDLYVGKVLNNKGAGREGDIVSGMIWAIDEGCEVVSMSLGRAVRVGETRTPEYEEAAAYGLERGCLILAAAGNESRREYGLIAPVGEPANAPSIVAVAALNPNLDVAPFSCGALEGEGGEVNLAAPGVGIFSTVPMPRRYAAFGGTSMACPHAAGIAALWAHSDPHLRGRALAEKLISSARDVNVPRRDAGAGLVTAPVENKIATS